MGYLKGALAVPLNLPVQSFYLKITFKNGIATAGEPILLEKGRFVNASDCQSLSCANGIPQSKNKAT